MYSDEPRGVVSSVEQEQVQEDGLAVRVQAELGE
jgi:hypothetical protein